MGAEYQAILYRPDGRHLAELPDYISIALARAINTVGSLTMVLAADPRRLGYRLKDYPRDARLALYRRPPGGNWRLIGDTIWFCRRAVLDLSPQGELQLTVTAFDANTLLTRRIVAYAAGSSEANKTAEADAMMKAVVRENLGTSATDADRDWSAYLSVDANLPAGTTPSITKAFSRRQVLSVLQEIAQASATEGTYLAFDIVAASPEQLAFRTFPGQRGQDRRWPDSPNPLLLSPEEGTLPQMARSEDYTTEASFVYAGGQGEGDSRIIETAQDDALIAASPFGRIEIWRDARNTEEAAGVEDEAKAALRAARAKQGYAGTVGETTALFGQAFGYGDYVTVDFGGEKRDCRLDAFRLTVGQNGGEAIDINLRVEGSPDGD